MIERTDLISIFRLYLHPLLLHLHHLSRVGSFITQKKYKMSFEPKQKVELDPPKDDPISLEYLAKCDGLWRLWDRLIKSTRTDVFYIGTNPDYPTYVAIKVSIVVYAINLSCSWLTRQGHSIRREQKQNVWPGRLVQRYVITLLTKPIRVLRKLKTSIRGQRCIKSARTVLAEA